MEPIFDYIQDYILVSDDRHQIVYGNQSLIKKLNFITEDNCSEDLKLFLKENKKIGTESSICLQNANHDAVHFSRKTFEYPSEKETYRIHVLKEENTYDLQDLELILDRIPFITFIKGVDGKYIYANQAYLKQFELKERSEIVGKTDREIWSHEEAELIISEDKTLIKEQGYLSEHEQLRVNNSQVWFYVFKSVALDKCNQVRSIFGMAKNITETKKMEEEKKILEQTIEKDRLRHDLMRNISHEFKTPINIIMTSIQLLKNLENIKQDTSQMKHKKNQYLDVIQQNSYRLYRLIDNMIEIKKINAGDATLRIGNHDVIGIVSELIVNINDYLRDKGLKVMFHNQVQEKVIACDPDIIEKMILNLISNALKSRQKRCKIQLILEVDENYLIIQVKDNGKGIQESKIHNIFDGFSQIDESLTRANEGAGIGLALVKSYVEMHRGMIEVKSQVSSGTCFSIKLPIYLKNLEIQSYGTAKLTSSEEKCCVEFSDIRF